MTVTAWLAAALRDIEERHRSESRLPLEGLARLTAILRAADWNVDATDRPGPVAHLDGR